MITIRHLKKSDYSKAMRFAINGMHLDWYVKNSIALRLYARYFFYYELSRATRVFVADVGGEMVGILLAEFYGEQPSRLNRLQRVYVRVFDWIQHIVAGKSVDNYDEANQQMLKAYKSTHTPDGEIVFLAADLEKQIKGIGTILLDEFEEVAKGKQIFLYTDNGSTYQFYEHRDFKLSQSKEITLPIGKTNMDLTVMLYNRQF